MTFSLGGRSVQGLHQGRFRRRLRGRGKRRPGKSVAIPAVLAGLLFGAASANADPILDFTGGGNYEVGIESTFGWMFSVSSPITVGALGLFDVGADGLVDSHDIGLWTSGGALLASAVITTADSRPVASASTDGDWRAIAIAPLTLPAGDYVIGASYVSGVMADHLFEGATPTTLPEVTLGMAVVTNGSELVFPSTVEPGVTPGYFGPTAFTIPEPSTWAMIVLGFAGLAFAGYRKAQPALSTF